MWTLFTFYCSAPMDKSENEIGNFRYLNAHLSGVGPGFSRITFFTVDRFTMAAEN